MSSTASLSSSEQPDYGLDTGSFKVIADDVEASQVSETAENSEDEKLNVDWPLASNGSMVAYAAKLLTGHPKKDELLRLLKQRVAGDTPEVLLGELLRLMHADADLKQYLPDLAALHQFAATSAEQNVDSVVSDMEIMESATGSVQKAVGSFHSKIVQLFTSGETKPDETIENADEQPLRLYLLKVLGEGGQAKVYLSYRNGEYRAVKLARGAEVTAIGRMKKEAALLAGKQHPAFLQMHEFRIVGSTIYMEIEYAGGGSFASLIDPELTTDDNYQLFGMMTAMKVAEGFKSIDTWYDDDENAVLHRDVKPDNILLSETGQPKIADFGLATRNNNNNTFKFTKSGELMGTPHYLPPEVVTNNNMKAYTPASEVYSLGCTYFHYFAGQTPFDGSLMQILQKHRNEEPDYSLIPNEEVRELVKEMMSKDQAVRPTMGVVAERMKAMFMRSAMDSERKKFYRSSIESKEVQLDPELLAYFQTRSGLEQKDRAIQQTAAFDASQLGQSVDFELDLPLQLTDSDVSILPFSNNELPETKDALIQKDPLDPGTTQEAINQKNEIGPTFVGNVPAEALNETFVKPIQEQPVSGTAEPAPLTDAMRKRLEEKHIRANSKMLQLIASQITALNIGDSVGRTPAARAKARLKSMSALQWTATLAVLFGTPALGAAGNSFIGSMRAERAKAAEVSLDTELAEWSSIVADDDPLSSEGLNAFRRELNAALASHPYEGTQSTYVRAFANEVPVAEYDVEVEDNRVVELELLYNTHRESLITEVEQLSSQLNGSASSLDGVAFDRLNVLLNECKQSKYFNEEELMHAANSACSYQYNVVKQGGTLQMVHLEELAAGSKILEQFDVLVAALARRESPDDIIVQSELTALYSLLQAWQHREDIKVSFYKKGLQKLPSYAVLSQSNSGLVLRNKVTTQGKQTVVESKYATLTFDNTRLTSIQLPEDEMALKNLAYYKQAGSLDVTLSVESIGTDDMVKYRKNLVPFTEGKSAVRYKLYSLSNNNSPVTIVVCTSIDGLLCINRETGEVQRIVETESLIRSKDIIRQLITYKETDYTDFTGHSDTGKSPPASIVARSVKNFLADAAFPSAFSNTQLPDDMDRLEFLLQVEPRKLDEQRVAQQGKSVEPNQR